MATANGSVGMFRMAGAARATVALVICLATTQACTPGAGQEAAQTAGTPTEPPTSVSAGTVDNDLLRLPTPLQSQEAVDPAIVRLREHYSNGDLSPNEAATIVASLVRPGFGVVPEEYTPRKFDLGDVIVVMEVYEDSVKRVTPSQRKVFEDEFAPIPLGKR